MIEIVHENDKYMGVSVGTEISGSTRIDDGVITVMYGDISLFAHRIYLNAEFDKPISLDDIRDYIAKRLKIEEYTEEITVLYEDWTTGYIFRYGAYTRKFWYILGTTQGFA